MTHLECDQCGKKFSGSLPNDLECNNSSYVTLFEATCEHLDSVDDGSRYLAEAGYHDGQFYCPEHWKPKSEELFIKDIRDGKIPEAHLDGVLEDYKRYLPCRTLVSTS